MKIEVDLMRIHEAPEMGRVAAVALLCALPRDEAELAVDEWQAVLRVLIIPRTPPEAAVTTPAAGAAIPPVAEAAEVTPPPAEVTPPEGSSSSYAKFSYGGRTFSSRKGGPAAAYRQALEDIAACETIRDLDELLNALKQLEGIFVEVGHPDRVDGLREAVARRRAGLVERAADRFVEKFAEKFAENLAETVGVEPEPPLVVDNIEDTIPLPEPSAVEPPPAPVAVTNGSTDPVHAMSLRELCRHAEHEVGRDAVIEAMRQHNVTKLAGLEAGTEAALRAAVMELLA